MAIQQSAYGLRELALFAGAGGGILGGHLLGWRTICAVERDAYAAGVLAQRQNDGCIPPFPIWSDVTTFDGRPWRGRVDVISGGFPCQDISVAGGGKVSAVRDPDFGLSSLESLAKLDPDTSSWRTPQFSLLGDWELYSETWPRWGLMRNGECWGLPMWALRTSGTGCGLWPTPTVCGNYNRKGASKTSGDGLATAVKKWPTPQASDNRDRGNLSSPAIKRRRAKGKQIMLSQSVSEESGQLNPTWVEWLMGWPSGWTDLKPLETDKFQWWQQEHSLKG